MTDKITERSDAARLRARAEEIGREIVALSAESVDTLPREEVQKKLHELLVHQIELEMQNDELRRTQTELDIIRARYFDLYDLAPVGYCTVSKNGLILEANITAAGLLGVSRSALVKNPLSRYILKEDQDIFYLHRKQLFDSGEPQSCELRMLKINEQSFWAQLKSTLAKDADGALLFRVILFDITERKLAQEALQKAMDDIRTLHGILPICMHCKKIRDDQGYWEQVEVYVRDRTEAEFSHGLCPACLKELYSEYDEDNDENAPANEP